MDPRTLQNDTRCDLHSRMSALQREIGGLAKDAAELEGRLTAIRADIAGRNQQLNTIKTEIARRDRPPPVVNGPPRVSEHALMRYIERVKGVDLDALNAEILTPEIIAAVNAGASAVILGGVKFVIRERVIVTTLDEGQRVKRRDAKRGTGIAEIARAP